MNTRQILGLVLFDIGFTSNGVKIEPQKEEKETMNYFLMIAGAFIFGTGLAAERLTNKKQASKTVSDGKPPIKAEPETIVPSDNED